LRIRRLRNLPRNHPAILLLHLRRRQIEQEISTLSPRANAKSSHAGAHLRNPVISCARRILPGRSKWKWDSNTVAAMQKFQSANGLDPSGKLDATSLQKLGLGSGIAGVSAPRHQLPRREVMLLDFAQRHRAATSAPAAAPKPASEPSASSSPSSDAAAPASSSACQHFVAATGAAAHSSQR